MDGACHPTKLKFNFLSESLNLFDRFFGLLILSVSLWITFYPPSSPPPSLFLFLKTETKRVLRWTAWWREGEGGGGHKSCMYERVRMTLDYMKKLLQLTIKEREINIRIRNKFSVRANPKITEHQLVLVKRSSLFYAQVWANEECV